LEIDFGNYFIYLLIFDFLNALGLGGIPFYPLSGGVLGSIIGLNADIYRPLLHIGHVKYS